MNNTESKLYYDKLKSKQKHFGNCGISLADHAEMWWFEHSNDIPNRETKSWNEMYEKWVKFAFEDL